MLRLTGSKNEWWRLRVSDILIHRLRGQGGAFRWGGGGGKG